MFTPTLDTKETAQNIKAFVATNKSEFWKILKPLIPFILGLNLLDTVITVLYMSGSDNDFTLGGIIATYFISVLVISWHRIVIHGADNYTPMNPFKPKKHELVFIGVAVALPLAVMSALGVLIWSLTMIVPFPVVMVGCFILISLAIYFYYRICFYFPAKAVDANITIKQAFDLSQGLLWDLIMAFLAASWKLLLVYFTYVIAIISILPVIAASMDSTVIVSLIAFVMFIPRIIYFQPLIIIIGITALSNYYLYAIQNKDEADLT